MDGMSIDRQIAAVKREVGMRRKVYLRRIADGKMTEAAAADEIAAMEAVQHTLETVRAERAEKVAPGLF